MKSRLSYAAVAAFLLLGSSAYAEDKAEMETVEVPDTPTATYQSQPSQSQTIVIKSEKVPSAMAQGDASVHPVMKKDNALRLNVKGQGVAPANTNSPAQAYALAKRAAIADAYRLLAEKVAGVRVEGQDFIRNMVVQRSQVRTYVDAMLRQSTLIETVFENGLCEVEMELVVDGSRWYNTLSQSASE